ncbi:response regulator transcription factor [Imperialibacter roseus]|uniref:Response regulator transcription factor n=1 Tax=Imperialibacter roseus TaxID=1324217 RepID=A0ABZ0IZ10_9BACT|nr:response regulator transcription factor [Imperialibacter roseus]WOK09374.1 response regulator transcription factor [Imperialibacter roseus]|tara:strand:- start:12728 stop:13387 length:660 start_codon:yes stop_codon:yes gene_type:complete
MAEIKVLVVDSFELARYGLREILQSDPDFNCLATLSSGKEALVFCETHQVDVILIDIAPPQVDGIEITREILGHGRSEKVIGLISNHKLEYLQGMIRAGANGYLLKTAHKDQIGDAIHKVHRGEVYFCEDVQKDLAEIIRRHLHFSPNGELLKDLTRQEKKVLKYVSRDFTNKEIAQELFISPRTVETHKRNLISKLGLKDARDLRRYSLRVAQEQQNS